VRQRDVAGQRRRRRCRERHNDQREHHHRDSPQHRGVEQFAVKPGHDSRLRSSLAEQQLPPGSGTTVLLVLGPMPAPSA
jgi:hypothetical protein